MERRKILLGSGAALATVFAGCSSTETGDEDPGGDDNGDDNGDDGVPGIDDDGLQIDGDTLTITDVGRDGDRLYVVSETKTTDPDVLEKELEKIGYDLAATVKDPDRFKAEISEVEWVLEHDGDHVFAVYVDVKWIVDYHEGKLSEDELAKKIKDSKDDGDK